MLRRIAVAVAVVVCTLGASSGVWAVVVVKDTWKDDTDADPASPTYSENGVDVDADGDVESAWFQGGTGELNPVGGAPAGPLRGTVLATSASWTTYFKAEGSEINLANAGDALEVRWVFAPTGVANLSDGTNTGQSFRLAVVDTPSASRLTANGSPAAPSGGNYLGYAMFMNMDQTLRRSTPFELRERNTGTAAFLGTANDWTAVINGDDGNTNDPGYANATTYTYTMTLTRNASNGLDIVSRMEGTGLGPNGQGFLQVSITDPDPSSFSYDTFAVRPSSAATSANSFDTSLFQVDFLPAPAVGDANFDGVNGVNGDDFLIWQRNLGRVGTGTLATGDANGDFDVDGDDLTVWRGQYAMSVPAIAGVPEPNSLVCGVLAMLGGMPLMRRRSGR